MAQVQGEEIYLSHSGQEIDDAIDEVVAARGESGTLSDAIESKTTISAVYGVDEFIPDGSFLDNYTTAGCFCRVYNKTEARPIYNVPVNFPFRLEVKSYKAESSFTSTVGNVIIQTIYCIDTINGSIPTGYTRTYRSDLGWSSWIKMFGALEESEATS